MKIDIWKLFSFEGITFREKGIVGVYDGEDPPVPIPNTVVKLAGAENTWLETARENRETPIKETWPVGQAVKTVASHAAIESSTLSRVTKQNCEKG